MEKGGYWVRGFLRVRGNSFIKGRVSKLNCLEIKIKFKKGL